ncbi:MAG TPA: ABC transporter permease subunit [Candidatus Sulfotelmatobacter sp.]|nr:ABC transporter permease subunit [Candidatus Sulfotelmatobacter sp.]
MRQFLNITVNAFMELVRQPIFLLLMTASVAFEIFLAVPYYFAFGDEPKLVENSVLAVMLLAGLFGAVLSASNSLAREIRSGTALAVLSKPVGRTQFLLAKFTGLALALTLLTYVNMVGVLVASRMAFDAYGKTDIAAVSIFGGGIALAYALAGFGNFFLRRPFVSNAVFGVAIFTTVAAFLIFNFTRQMESMGTQAVVNWNLLPAGILILFALWVLAAIALACSTRLDMIATLSICTAIFLLGLMSDYFFGQHAARGGWWASALYSVVPNWQLFWLADAIDSGKSTFHWDYVGKAFAYAVCYAGAALALGAALFEERELS